MNLLGHTGRTFIRDTYQVDSRNMNTQRAVRKKAPGYGPRGSNEQPEQNKPSIRLDVVGSVGDVGKWLAL
jgi:hypothetical protein